MSKWTVHCVLIIFLSTMTGETLNEYIPGHADNAYFYKPGDILLAGLFSIHGHGGSNSCGKDIFDLAVYHATSMMYAVGELNSLKWLPNNLTLGYVIFDACRKPSTALSQLMHILPDKSPSNNQSSSRYPYFKVAGLIGPATSSTSSLISPLLGIFQIPHISFYATSDALSDKTNYPYFLRTIPPSKFQVRTILALLQKFSWSYVSAVYQSDTYGRDGINMLETMAVENDFTLCFAAKFSIHKYTTIKEYDSIVKTLKTYTNATVLILYAYTTEAKHLLAAIYRAKAAGNFIVIGSDGLGGPNLNNPSSLAQLPTGLLVADAFMSNKTQFDAYFKDLNASDAENNIVLRDFWESKFDCSFANNTCDASSRYDESRGFYSDSSISLVLNGVSAFAQVIKTLILADCPAANSATVSHCIDGSKIRSMLLNSTQIGPWESVQFDEFGDRVGKYVIRNIQRSGRSDPTVETVAIWDINSNAMNLTDTPIQWHSNVSRFGPYGVPLSVCSTPCPPGFEYQRRKQVCCWDCLRCRPNERTVVNQTRCQRCPLYWWPDSVNFTTCQEIEPSEYKWSSPFVLVVVVFASFGFVLTILVFILFCRARESKLIKASSVELMYIIIVSILVSLVLVFTHLSPPTTVICYFNMVGPGIVFSAVYAPILIKTRRIFVIFDYGKRTRTPPRWISRHVQLIFVSTLITIQIVLCGIVAIMEPPLPTKSMPSPDRRFVERICSIYAVSVMVPLGFNFLLVLSCAVYAFKTRHVPDNFNESKFIAFSVYSSIVMWLAFIAIYFTNGAGSRMSLTFITAPIVANAYVILLILFCPKLYAVYFLEESDLRILPSTLRGNSLRKTSRNAIRSLDATYGESATAAVSGVDISTTVT
ncbi:metabotropic glutamate receptor 3-like [Tubulanus polymorphus]|uniref:metabotropic glutamate receptor 3-like n=1 Tax=Tubulanus polymorphus TaxID=672921 RepID=UPI003DA56CCE